MTAPKLFIGSSSEGLEVARALQAELGGIVETGIWSQGVFEPGQNYLEDLFKFSTTYDFAVMVLRADDWERSREKEQIVPRDNVLFEVGLFMGSIGRRRTFLLYDMSSMPKLPSDLAGITTLTFEERDETSALRASLGPAAQSIGDKVKELGCNTKNWINLNPLGESVAKIAQHSHDFIVTEERVLRAFKRHIEKELDEWEDEAIRWSEGVFLIQNKYSTLLREVYSYARSEIFSTSVAGYSDYWSEDNGKGILNVQRENKTASSTRVFILDSRSDLDQETKQLLKLHQDHGVKVLVLFLDEYEQHEEAAVGPQDVADWTIVDEKVVGVTMQFGKEMQANWTVDDPKKNERFVRYRDRLIEYSEPFLG